MMSLINAIQYVLFNHRKLASGVCAILCILMLFAVSQLKLNENILDLMPLQNESVRDYAEVLDYLQSSENLVFMVKLKPDRSNMDHLITVGDELATALRNNALIQQVRYKWDAGEMSEAISVLRSFHADLFTRQDAQYLQAHLTPEALDLMIESWRRLLQETPAPFLSQQFKVDPLGLDRLFLQKLESMQNLDHTAIVRNGILFSSDNSSLLMTATPRIPSTDSRGGEKLVSDIQRTVERLTEEASPAVDIAWLGGHRFTIDNASSLKRDIALIASISIAMISLLCLLVFKRIHYVPLALLPALFGGLTAVSSAFLFRSGVSAIVLGIGGVLIAITVDYGLHVLYRTDHIEDDRLSAEAIIKIFSGISTPLLLCAGTTLAAFFVLIFSAFPGYSQLGWFSVIGITAAVAFVLFMLPLFISGGGYHKKRILPLTKWLTSYRNMAQKYRFVWIVLSISATLIALPGLFRLHFDGDIEKLNMVSPSVQKDWKMLKTTFPGILNTLFIIVKGPNENDLFERSEKINLWLQRKQEDGVIQFSAASWLYPSMKTQLENRKRWEDFWSKDRKNHLIESMKIISKKHGMRPSFFINWIEKLPGSMHLYDVKQVMEQPLIGQILSSQLYLENDPKVVLIPFTRLDSKKGKAFEKELTGSFPYASVADSKAFLRDIIQLIFREFVKLGSLALIITLAILFLFARSISRTVGFFLPLFQAMVFTFGTMGWLHIPLNIMSVLVIIFIFGLVVDYSLFLGHTALNNDADFSQTGGAITISALTTLWGLGALIFARHPALHSIGITALLGVSSGFFFTMMNYGWFWTKKEK